MTQRLIYSKLQSMEKSADRGLMVASQMARGRKCRRAFGKLVEQYSCFHLTASAMMPEKVKRYVRRGKEDTVTEQEVIGHMGGVVRIGKNAAYLEWATSMLERQLEAASMAMEGLKAMPEKRTIVQKLADGMFGTNDGQMEGLATQMKECLQEIRKAVEEVVEISSWFANGAILRLVGSGKE